MQDTPNIGFKILAILISKLKINLKIILRKTLLNSTLLVWLILNILVILWCKWIGINNKKLK